MVEGGQRTVQGSAEGAWHRRREPQHGRPYERDKEVPDADDLLDGGARCDGSGSAPEPCPTVD